MVGAQEGDLAAFYKVEPKILFEFRAERDAFITNVDALSLGRAALFAGAGRITAEQDVDPHAGIRLRKKSGQLVKKDEVIATVYSSRNDSKQIIQDCLKKGIRFSADGESQNYAKRPLFLGKIDSNGWSEM